MKARACIAVSLVSAACAPAPLSPLPAIERGGSGPVDAGGDARDELDAAPATAAVAAADASPAGAKIVLSIARVNPALGVGRLAVRASGDASYQPPTADSERRGRVASATVGALHDAMLSSRFCSIRGARIEGLYNRFVVTVAFDDLACEVALPDAQWPKRAPQVWKMLDELSREACEGPCSRFDVGDP